MEAIEAEVNAIIMGNGPGGNRGDDTETAKTKARWRLFGKMYGKPCACGVEGFSKKLCGGTHAHEAEKSTDLHRVESSVAAGIRRIEGVCGKKRLALCSKARSAARDLATALSCTEEQIQERVTEGAVEQRLTQKSWRMPAENFGVELERSVKTRRGGADPPVHGCWEE
jgi:alanyl-tRNA synthetase